MSELDDILAKIAAENRKAEAKRPKPKKAEVENTATFLRGWAKGKDIVRQSADSTFWAAGTWMTKLDAKMADALVAAGHATIKGNSTQGGARLTMVKV